MADLTPAVLAKRLALAVELLGEVAAAEGQWRGSAPEAASGGLRKRRRWRLRVRGQSLLLDGEPVPIDLTAEARAVTLCYLGHLIRAQGEWVSGSEIDLAEKQQPNEGLAGHRWDRIRKRLPDALRSLIETNRRKGYRLSGEALA